MVDKKSFNKEIANKKRREYLKKWRKEHPEKVKQYNENYWARKFERDLLESGANDEHN